MDSSLLIAFWAVSFSLAMTPGADWAFAIASGIKGGRVWSAVAGMLLGYLTITLVVAAGTGALVTRVPLVLVVLTWAGAAYLFWLGIKVLCDPPVATVADEQPAGTAVAVLMRGFAISGLNPKALLLFLALLPQFTRADTLWPVGVQLGVMGLMHTLNCGMVYLGVGTAAKTVLRARPNIARRVGQVSGMVMITIALLLAGEQLFPAMR